MTVSTEKATPRKPFAGGAKPPRWLRRWLGPGFFGALVIWFMYSMDQRMGRMEERIARMEERLAQHGERLARIETHLRLAPYEPPEKAD